MVGDRSGPVTLPQFDDDEPVQPGIVLYQLHASLGDAITGQGGHRDPLARADL